ncbi:LysR family transcriptional regulator [Tabrizicola sp. J26]|uniref:LysR family transcriptional regulator n=1 Tax=Alitabrizicola rongguiensis TaxID=2909234 RepID=UPI001F34C537|nr:LysR family transcriptional regulator [Tabrizicola rongguiensis]MCF1709731.1 LysR family transcriptional regulator [Tabrizicola rongguiensis]
MFAAVMETGSFAAAAARLGTSPGQASKLVSRLESTLGVRLLNRTTRALSPTEAGQAYFDRIRVVLDEIEAIDQSIRQEAERPRGRLRISAPLTFGVHQLRFALTDFACLYPEIALDVNFTDRVVNLVDEGFDMAVRIGRPVDSTLIARRLCDSRLRLVAAPSYLDRAGIPQDPADLARHACIIDTNFREPGSWLFRTSEGVKAVPVSGRLRFSNAEVCLAAAERGLGLAYLPDFVAADALAAGRVQPVLAELEIPPYGIYTVYPPGRHLAAKVRALIDFLSSRYRGDVDWTQPGKG